MNLSNHYWYFKSALTPRFCDELVRYGKEQQDLIALTGSELIKIENKKILSKKDLKDLKKTRDSNVCFLSDTWIYKEIHPYIHMANKLANWNFDWDYSEACQFTKYKLNQFYDWHSDAFDKPFINSNNEKMEGKIRKLSVTCSLSDPKDYEGGELEFDFRDMNPNKKNIKKCTEILERGSIVVFPSHIWHRVKPVTKGTRYSLVIWNLGYPFR